MELLMPETIDRTGWVSGMAMPAALIGFAYFKAIGNLEPFLPLPVTG